MNSSKKKICQTRRLVRMGWNRMRMNKGIRCFNLMKRNSMGKFRKKKKNLIKRRCSRRNSKDCKSKKIIVVQLQAAVNHLINKLRNSS